MAFKVARYKVSKSGERLGPYWELVTSVWTSEGPRQIFLRYLGKDPGPGEIVGNEQDIVPLPRKGHIAPQKLRRYTSPEDMPYGVVSPLGGDAHNPGGMEFASFSGKMAEKLDALIEENTPEAWNRVFQTLGVLRRKDKDGKVYFLLPKDEETKKKMEKAGYVFKLQEEL